MEIGAIVAAAGPGLRLGRGAKALVELNGRTALARVVELFLVLDEITRVVVVAPPSRLELAEREVAALAPRKPVSVRPGGDTRQKSVRAGVKALEGCDYVLVHDAARPMASAALVRRVIAAAIQTGAAIPGLPPRDPVKRVEGGRIVASLARSQLMLAQTPQGFQYTLLERAHFEAADAGLVGDDDAQLVAATGHAVTVVPGEPANVKLTTLDDLELLEALLREQEASRAAAAPAP